MANAEQPAKLEEGVAAWNAWRAQTPERIDLDDADLHDQDLKGIDLNGASLIRVNLTDANLAGANLTNADLYSANLSATFLIRANLVATQFASANMSHASLTGANLQKANLSSANLSGANLRTATINGVTFLLGNTNLTGAICLDDCVHLGPSILDHSTLAKSGPLPLAFLRGCGPPQNLITYFPSLLNQPIQFYSCFISYSTQDQPFADRLHADLQNAGVRSWFAPHDMSPGRKIHEQIDEAIRLHDKLLLILSSTA